MTGIWDLLARFAGPVQQPPSGAAGLVTCSSCRVEAVVPVKWEEAGDDWRVVLRCGACGARSEVTLDDHEAARLDAELDRATHELGRTVAALERRHMLEDLETLSVALERDLIGADDFAPRLFAH